MQRPQDSVFLALAALRCLPHQRPITVFDASMTLLPALAAIVAVFASSLGARKFSVREGRLLKQMSSAMMLELGALLLLAPESVSHARIGSGLMAVAGVSPSQSRDSAATLRIACNMSTNHHPAATPPSSPIPSRPRHSPHRRRQVFKRRNS